VDDCKPSPCAAVVGTKVYFGPAHQDNVGVLDTESNVFSTVATAGTTSSANPKYTGRAVQVEPIKPTFDSAWN